MAIEIKGELPPSPWDPLKTTLNSLVAEVGSKSISHFEVLFEVKEDCPLRSVKVARTRDDNLEIEVRTASSLKKLLPEEFILGTLGWDLVNDGRIRWRRLFGQDALLYSVTMCLMMVPESAYQLKEDLWFSIQADKPQIVAKHTSNLWHYKKNKNFLCLPGQNRTMVLEAA